MNLLCKVRGHKRDRHRVWFDKLDWRTDCVRCKLPLVKDHRTQAWRSLNPEEDSLVGRKAKPGRAGPEIG